MTANQRPGPRDGYVVIYGNTIAWISGGALYALVASGRSGPIWDRNVPPVEDRWSRGIGGVKDGPRPPGEIGH